jgi:pimeloyl-ACP methyl ester carboxylesterase
MSDTGWRNGTAVINGFRQFWRAWQPPGSTALPVLALHGSLTQSGMWNALAEAAGTIPMLCPDQRGFGLSEDLNEDLGDDSCAAFAADAVALAQQLLPQRYVIMGHSFACSIALKAAQLAADHVAAVVLVDPVVPSGQPRVKTPGNPPPEKFATRQQAERHFRDSEEGEWTAATLRRFVEDVMLRDGEAWRFPYTPARLKRLRAFTASPASDFDLFALAAAVRFPVLVFRGGVSARFPAAAEPRLLAAFALKPELVLCPESGHFPSATDTGRVATALKDFLGRVA